VPTAGLHEFLVQLPTTHLWLPLVHHTDIPSSPSHTRNAPYDFLRLEKLPFTLPNFPACDLWPTDPPRGEIYTELSHLTHPLVSPVAMPLWRADGAPMFFACGEEKISDEVHFAAARIAKAGTADRADGQPVVQYLQFDKLPHIFYSLFPALRQSQYMMESFARFCYMCVHQKTSLQPRHVRFEPSGENQYREVGLGLFANVDTNLNSRLDAMKAMQRRRKVWTGPKESSTL
jgi:hypothetical protein